MNKRKICTICKIKLIVYQGHYMHPDTICNGLKDMIYIEATIDDKFLYDKFKEEYGKPELDDYDRLNKLEKNILIRIILFFIYQLNKIKKKFS